MKKAKYVLLCDGFHHNLKQIEKNKFKMNEIEGEIIFCETKPTGYGSCLELKIKNCDEDIWWQNQSKKPIPALCGQILRGFYENKSNENKVICLEAYELLNNQGMVLTRDRGGYKFIED